MVVVAVAPAAAQANSDAIEVCVGTNPCTAQHLPTEGVVGGLVHTQLSPVCDVLAGPADPPQPPPANAHVCFVSYGAPDSHTSVIHIPGVAGLGTSSHTEAFGPGAGTDFTIHVDLLR